MGVRELMEKIRGNPLEKMKARELREEEIRLKNQLERVRKGIDDNEKEKKKKFREGIGADLFKKRMLVQEIGALDMEAKLKLRTFTTAHRQLRFVKNFLIVKNYEQQLKDVGLWKKLTAIPQANLEGFLIRISLDGKEFDEVLNELNKPFEMDVAEIGEEMAEEEKKMLESWAQVEAGALEPEKAESELSIDRELQKEEI
ncbi:chromosome assembly protein [Dehalococcoidia bacterium]|nr:chromosome assembly protein [Dehalococcoidia bacterium]MCL0050721.1 chromosome assembly protein [Dehalococcoidia bacterium]MCL0059629.1 chromosome assembly protein [Dehalococcoidia bacterium]MCL0064313.1 chromosome assembly protein [Dehalococcoidia bacterium]MCL0081652.1 chromosome assembly protein [Dehalococcoidia bacterium]